MNRSSLDTARSQSQALRGGLRAAAVAGIVAGPFFLVVSLLQMPLYEEFDITKHPFSFLSIGEYGWVEQVTFVITGCLYIASAPVFAAGVGGRAGRWAAVMAVLLGSGKVIAGIFVVDPAFGFPAGAPAGQPAQVSTGSNLHGLGFAVAMIAWVVLLLLVAHRFRCVGAPGWAWAARSVAVALVVVPPLLMTTAVGTLVLYVVLPTAYLLTSAVVWRLATGAAAAEDGGPDTIGRVLARA